MNNNNSSTSGRPYLSHPPSSYPNLMAQQVAPGQTKCYLRQLRVRDLGLSPSNNNNNSNNEQILLQCKHSFVAPLVSPSSWSLPLVQQRHLKIVLHDFPEMVPYMSHNIDIRVKLIGTSET